MYAVIVSGGKQHRVTEGETLKLEKLEVATGGVGPPMSKVVRSQPRYSRKAARKKCKSSNSIAASISASSRVTGSGSLKSKSLVLKVK